MALIFLLAGLWAIVPMLVVAGFMGAGRWPSAAVPLLTWHGHEMIFGFTAAAIAGFLLTAVPSWTGTRAVSGYPLLVVVIVGGRIVPAFTKNDFAGMTGLDESRSSSGWIWPPSLQPRPMPSTC